MSTKEERFKKMASELKDEIECVSITSPIAEGCMECAAWKSVSLHAQLSGASELPDYDGPDSHKIDKSDAALMVVATALNELVTEMRLIRLSIEKMIP